MLGTTPVKSTENQSGKRKLSAIVAVALVAGIFLGATFSGDIVSLPRAPNLSHAGAGSSIQGLILGGTVTVKVLGSNGRVVSTWSGPDPINPADASFLIGCILGHNGGALSNGLSQPGVGGDACDTFISQVVIFTDTPSGPCTNTGEGGLEGPAPVCTIIFSPASNTPTAPPPETSCLGNQDCTGWVTEATYGPSTFTSSNCGSSCSVQEVETTNTCAPTLVIQSCYLFDYVCTSTMTYDFSSSLPCNYEGASPPPSIATVSPGDSLLVTIQFTVT